VAFNYAELAVTADALITEFGRSLTLSKRDRTPADSSKPWQGPASPGTDTTVTLLGVVNPSADEDMPGTVIKRGDAYAIISAIGAGSTTDVAQFDTLIDGSTKWHILNASGVNPGPVNLVWILHLKR
jgi:hypothetical protein